MSIPKQIWEDLNRDVVQDRWGGDSVDAVLDDLQQQYPNAQEHRRFQQQFVEEMDQYVDKAIDDLTEEDLLRYLNEPGVWRQVVWTQLGSFADDLRGELEDWLRRYIKAEVDYVE